LEKRGKQRRSEILEEEVVLEEAIVPKVEEVQGNKLEEDEVLEEDDKIKNL